MAKKKPAKTPATPPAGRKPAETAGPMNVTLLEQIVKLMSANGLNTVDLRDGDQRVVLRRGAAVAYAPPPASSVAHHAPAPAAASASAPAGSPAAPTPAGGEEAGTVAIKSPMVGTFYAKPSPDAKPFVSVGSQVDDETDVCVIEAMKVFNNIKAETRGTITKVLAEDGKPVEFGQVLFLVKP